MPRLPRSCALTSIAAAAYLAACSDGALPTAAPGVSRAAPALFAARPTHIRGRFDGIQVKIPIAGEPMVFRTEQTATGTIDPVGPATLAWAVPQVRIDPVRRQAEILTPQWTITLTLPGGAQVFARYVFPATTVHFTPLGDYTATVTLALTGGTGPYAALTGSGTAVVRGNAFTGHFTSNLEGQVAPAP